MIRIAVTNRMLCEGDFLERIRQIAGGTRFDAVLLREKDLTEPEYETLAGEVLAICRREGMPCLLHGFPGVAKRLGHPFLHLPLPVWENMGRQEREELRGRMEKMGTSVHSGEQLQKALQLGADYVLAGHIFATDCKRGLPPRGLRFLGEICSASTVPVYAIGGIRAENENLAAGQGAAGVCIMSGCMRGECV